MNLSSLSKSTDLNPDQVETFRELIGAIVSCCQERTILESRLLSLPPAELRCLQLIADDESLTAGRLATRLEVGKSRITSLVNGLLAKGLIERRTSSRDGRRRLISLTPLGVEKSREAKDFIGEAHARVLAGIDPDRRGSVLETLKLVREAMEIVKGEMGLPTKQPAS